MDLSLASLPSPLVGSVRGEGEDATREEIKEREREKERWRRVMNLLNELRSQYRQIGQFPDTLGQCLYDARDVKDLLRIVDEKHLQGMMMVFNFLHPATFPGDLNRRYSTHCEVQRVVNIFDSFRTYLQGKLYLLPHAMPTVTQ